MSSVFDLRTVQSTFIFNPNSGHNARNPYLLEQTRAFITQHQLQAEIQLTTHPRHATQLAAAAVSRGHAAVISIGGDGTLNEIAQALIDSPCVLGLIPCGSGNGLGRHLGIPRPDQSAYGTLLSGRLRSIDCGLINGHPFFNVAGIGFDAEISARFNQLTKRGLPAYVKTTLRTLHSYRSAPYTIHSATGSTSTAAFIIAVSNSDQYGNNCFIAPGAQVDDGRLNLTIIKRANWRNAVPLAYRLFRGSIARSSVVQCMAGHQFTIERQSAGPIHTDGEVYTAPAVIDIQIKPLALKVLVPVVR